MKALPPGATILTNMEWENRLGTPYQPTPADIERTESDTAKRTISDLNQQSINLMREYIASKADAPAALKAIEAAAVEARKKVK